MKPPQLDLLPLPRRSKPTQAAARASTKRPPRSESRAAPRGPGEFELIARFLSQFDVPRPPFGPGDDCAVLPEVTVAAASAQHHHQVVTVDALVEEVHFTRATFSLEDVGHKALAVNLSDLAAMGATPSWFLVALAGPKTLDARQVTALGRGMASLARAAGIRLIGGNLTRAPSLSLTITAAGEAVRPMLRSGARPGHQLYVSGTLGDAAHGLRVLGKSPTSRHLAAARQRRPMPRLSLGQLAAEFASAAIDVSDGLGQDLRHLCRASKVSAVVAVEQVPVTPELVRENTLDWMDLALSGGEDYELLLAVPEARAEAFEAACLDADEPLAHIGEIVRPRGGRSATLDDLTPRFLLEGKELKAGGFDHFSSTVI